MERNMRLSDNGKKLLTEWEGFKRKAYLDEAGKLTVGVGHLLTAPEMERGAVKLIVKRKGLVSKVAVQWIDYREGLTDKEVGEILSYDVLRFEAIVTAKVKPELNQNQFDALVIFTFNVGIGSFKSSTLLKKLNEELFGNVPFQLARWNKVTNPATRKLEVSQGLVNRRRYETELWLARVTSNPDSDDSDDTPGCAEV